MTEPNYSYCACFCPGIILNCPHYEPYRKPFKVCKTYKLIEEIAPKHKFRLSRASLDKIVAEARKAGV